MRKIVSSLILFLLTLFIVSCEVYTDFLESGDQELPDYQLRDRGPAGGWIFYIIDNADGTKTYYEAAAVDQGTQVVWINAALDPNPQETLNGNTSAGIGTGWSNTLAIISQANHSSSAALLCRSYRGGGFQDWFLPSEDELEQMCWNLRGMASDGTQNPEVPTEGVCSFGDAYWNSTEFNLYNARCRNFFNGYQTYLSKQNYRDVRAVRSFTY